jgi:DNA-binding response OmpR family regulator
MTRLLVVDDDEDVAESLRSILEDEGFEVDVARDGMEGLQKLDPNLPDAVLLDVEMPILDGPGMAYEMFVQDVGKEEIPIVLLSGAANLPDVVRQVGTPYSLAKPFGLVALLSLVQRALQERTPPSRASARP